MTPTPSHGAVVPTNAERVQIIPYDELWPSEFADCARELRHCLGDLARRIDHIGSTAVPGLAAKDVIDVQITVDSLDAPDIAALFIEAGYEHVEAVTEDHRPPGAREPAAQWRKLLFRARPPRRSVHAHVRVDGAANARYALLFRDYLRADAAAAAAYAEVKRRLATVEPPLPPPAYTTIKDPVCDLVTAAAEAWARERGWDFPSTDA